MSKTQATEGASTLNFLSSKFSAIGSLWQEFVVTLNFFDSLLRGSIFFIWTATVILEILTPRRVSSLVMQHYRIKPLLRSTHSESTVEALWKLFASYFQDIATKNNIRFLRPLKFYTSLRSSKLCNTS